MTRFYHRTCSHRIDDILTGADGESGMLQPQRQHLLGITATWLTYVPWASREDLALSRGTLISCDRMEYLLEVQDPDHIVTWQALKRELPQHAVRTLESAPGARPDFWCLTGLPQRVRLVTDPALVRGRR